MAENRHKIPVSGYNPRTKELFFSWRSDEAGGDDAPDRTLVFNLEYGHSSYMDHGFTAMVNYQSYNQQALREFLIESILSSNKSICDCDDSVSDLIQGDPYIVGAASGGQFPSLWNSTENTSISADSTSLCTALGSSGFEAFCEDGTEGSTFVVASSSDKCLKQYEEDYYQRDIYNGSTYVNNGYDSILESGALHFDTDDEKLLQRVTIEYSGVGSVFTNETCDTNSNTTVTCDSNTKIKRGQSVSGSGIPDGTIVSAVNTDNAVTSFTLSKAATATATNVTLTFTVPVTAAMKFGKSNQPDQLLSGISYTLLSGTQILDDQSVTAGSNNSDIINNNINPDDKAYFNNYTRGRYLGYQVKLSGNGPATISRVTLSTRLAEK